MSCLHSLQVLVGEGWAQEEWRCLFCGTAIRPKAPRVEPVTDPLKRFCGIHDLPFQAHGGEEACPTCYNSRGVVPIGPAR